MNIEKKSAASFKKKKKTLSNTMSILCPAAGESKARFLFRWFVGAFVFAIIVGVFSVILFSSSHCVNLSALKDITFWSFLASMLMTGTAFVVCNATSKPAATQVGLKPAQ